MTEIFKDLDKLKNYVKTVTDYAEIIKLLETAQNINPNLLNIIKESVEVISTNSRPDLYKLTIDALFNFPNIIAVEIYIETDNLKNNNNGLKLLNLPLLQAFKLNLVSTSVLDRESYNNMYTLVLSFIKKFGANNVKILIKFNTKLFENEYDLFYFAGKHYFHLSPIKLKTLSRNLIDFQVLGAAKELWYDPGQGDLINSFNNISIKFDKIHIVININPIDETFVALNFPIVNNILKEADLFTDTIIYHVWVKNKENFNQWKDEVYEIFSTSPELQKISSIKNTNYVFRLFKLSDIDKIMNDFPNLKTIYLSYESNIINFYNQSTNKEFKMKVKWITLPYQKVSDIPEFPIEKPYF